MFYNYEETVNLIMLINILEETFRIEIGCRLLKLA